MLQKNKHQGFTLLEILLVVVIVAIMTTVGVNLINSQSIERVIMNQAKVLEQNLMFLCEKAVLDNQAFGLEFNALGYQAFGYRQQTWQMIESAHLTELDSAVAVSLFLDGLEQKLPNEPEGLPQLVCQADGSMNAFELRFRDGSDLSGSNYYGMQTESPWRLSTAWHEK